MSEEFPKYLCTFDDAGNRTATYLCDNAEEVTAKIALGCIEVSEEDWNTYIGNKNDGIRYVRGSDGKPTAYVDTLDETKTKALTVQYEKYQKLKYAVAWVATIGFDTDKDSQTDWLSVMTVLKNANATSGYYKVYTDKTDLTKKSFEMVTVAQLTEAGNVSRTQQTSAYTDFEAVKSKINAATTKDELSQYLVAD